MRNFIILSSLLLLFFSCQKNENDAELNGIWQQTTDRETVIYLEFTTQNELIAYHKNAALDCYVALMSKKSPMVFRRNGDLLTFDIMGFKSKMRYKIENKELRFSVGEDEDWSASHGDFLNDSYVFVGNELDGCVVSLEDWRSGESAMLDRLNQPKKIGQMN